MLRSVNSNDRRSRLVAAGGWLREQRERRGYHKAIDFARALGVDASLVSNYERGVTSVPDDRAEQIAEVLGMDVIEVRRNLGLWVPDDARQPERPSETAEEELLERIRRDPRQRRRLLDALLAGPAQEPKPDKSDEEENPDIGVTG
jgi:transcriptional regulator with XRE-family HTH domain